MTGKQNEESKILFFDLETSLMVASTFTLYPEAISHNNLIQDWNILSVAWKFKGDDQVQSLQVTDKKLTNDKQLCIKFREVLLSADIIVGHNAAKFDIKKFNARLIQHKLQPLPTISMVDTLREVKKVATFSSHRLDYLGKILFNQGKLQHSSGLWIECLKGNKEALNEMVAYNKVDVLVLEKLYNYLLPYMKNHPHVGVIQGGIKSDCNKCGSINMQNRGFSVTTTGLKKQRLQCQDCGSWSATNIKSNK